MKAYGRFAVAAAFALGACLEPPVSSVVATSHGTVGYWPGGRTCILEYARGRKQFLRGTENEAKAECDFSEGDLVDFNADRIVRVRRQSHTSY